MSRGFARICGVVVLMLVNGAGCARTTSKLGTPDTRSNSAAARLLADLREKYAQTLEEVRALDRAAEEFRQANPGSFVAGDLIPQRLQQFSRAYVEAQLATISAKSQYPEGHPTVKSARRLEQELAQRFEQELALAVEHAARLEAYQKLQLQRAAKQEMAQRIDEQIRALEVALP